MTRAQRPFMIFVFFLALAMGAVSWVGEDWQSGVGGFAVVFGFWLLMCFVPERYFELLKPGTVKDERQRRIADEAREISGMLVITVALVGAMVDIAHGKYGEFGIICSVGGASFLLALILLPRRR